MPAGHKPACKRMQEIHLLCKRHGFQVTEIRSDKQFKKTLEMFRHNQLQKFQTVIKLNIANTKECIPHIERNNRAAQDRTHCDCVNMPHAHLPRTLVERIAMESSKKLNFFLANHGISKHCSQRMMVHEENIDFDAHCAHAIGEYIQGEYELARSNANAPRALDFLHLRPLSASNKGYDLLHLQTNKVVNCRKIWSMPVTASAIQQVRALARMDNMPKGLKIANKTGLVSYDASKTAGVDYVQDANNDVIESAE